MVKVRDRVMVRARVKVMVRDRDRVGLPARPALRLAGARHD